MLLHLGGNGWKKRIKMNYSLDHNVLRQDPYISGLKGSHKRASWIVVCAIKHFTIHTGGMDLYATKFADDIGVKPGTLKKALEGLVNNNIIKVVREYQRVGNIPRRYRYSPKVQKVYPHSHKDIAPGDKVNNSKGIIKQNNNSSLGKNDILKLKKEDPQRYAELKYFEHLKKQSNNSNV